MKIVIIEDELAAANQLKYWLNYLQINHQIVATIDTVSDGIRWFLSNESPDLIFSDIQLADGLSFEIFEQVQIKAPLIFTSAYDEYAIRAFKHNSVDYLLKPIEAEALKHAIEKFEHQQLIRQEVLQHLIQQHIFTPKAFRKSFLVRYRDKLLPVKTTEFAYFFIENGLVYGQLHDSRRFVIDQKLEDLDNQLNPSEFVRANRQFILSRACVTEIEPLAHSRALVKVVPQAPFEVMISKEKVTSFKKWYEQG
ncbi:MAG: LytTR family DNA-binding domain-containing protein [Spirosomataceae bacterium]